MTTSAHSVLSPAGPQAAAIDHLWWLFFWVTLGVFVIVVGFLAAALVRQRGRAAPPASSEPALTRGVAVATALSTVIIIGLLFADLVMGRALRIPQDADAINLVVTGHQWWWEVQYLDPAPQKSFITANEIHFPVGRTIRLQLQSADVIHSFWAPSFAGKKDLVPGHPAYLAFRADRAGVFRGQCAEFCGLQHAHMDLIMVAEPPAQYEAWAEQQRKSAASPASGLARRGKEVFLAGTCSICHTIDGTLARSRVGPNLTHIGSRLRIAAGAFPNTRGYLAGWIIDAPSLKPGVIMPPNPLPGDDVQALVAYLESLR